MTKKIPHEHLYFGKAGHLFVMSEFLLRGWNVAIPEVDVGDDIFVVRDSNDELRRIQVKSSKSSSLKKEGYFAQFNLSIRQLRDTQKLVYYVFVVRHFDEWSNILIINQDELLALFETESIGSVHKDNLTLRLTFRKDKVFNKQTDFSIYQNNFEDFLIT
jgi:hypothetical protein